MKQTLLMFWGPVQKEQKDQKSHKESEGGLYIAVHEMVFKYASCFSAVSNHTEQELLCLTNPSPIDLLCEPVPSCLPSPQLRPDPVLLESVDLIQFEEHPSSLSGKNVHP